MFFTKYGNRKRLFPCSSACQYRWRLRNKIKRENEEKFIHVNAVWKEPGGREIFKGLKYGSLKNVYFNTMGMDEQTIFLNSFIFYFNKIKTSY